MHTFPDNTHKHKKRMKILGILFLIILLTIVLKMVWVAAEGGPPGLMVAELLVNPMLRRISGEIDEEIAERLAEYYGLDRLVYRTPGESVSQSMYAASDTTVITGYFGFPLE